MSNLSRMSRQKKSSQINFPALSFREKKSIASLIRLMHTSIPTTAQPFCAKGSKFPPSPHPISAQ